MTEPSPESIESAPHANSKHWLLFCLIFAAATMVTATLWGGEINAETFGYGIGMTTIPALIAFFIMRKGRNISAGYAVFLVLAGLLIWKEFDKRSDSLQKEILTGCLERNVEVDALPEDQQKTYCGCYSDQLAPQLQWYFSMAAMSFRTSPRNPLDDGKVVAMATQASEECAAKL